MTQHQHLFETKLSDETVFKGKMLEVRRDRVSLPDGTESIREYIIHPGAVVVLAILDNGNLLFERQFRYPVGHVFLELPAGKIDPGEDILATGKRELLEETGYAADDWQYVGVMHPCIGYSNERIEIFIARGAKRVSEPRLDHGEFLEILEMSLDEVKRAVLAGEVTDAKTVTALYWAEQLLR